MPSAATTKRPAVHELYKKAKKDGAVNYKDIDDLLCMEDLEPNVIENIFTDFLDLDIEVLDTDQTFFIKFSPF